MWENIGSDVKGLAKVVCWLGIIGSIIYGIILIMATTTTKTVHPYIGAGIAWIILGSFASWIGSWVIYAIGEAAEAAEVQLNTTENKIYKTFTEETKKQLRTETEANKVNVKPNEEKELAKKHNITEPGYYWICPDCGAASKTSLSICRNCKKLRDYNNSSIKVFGVGIENISDTDAAVVKAIGIIFVITVIILCVIKYI